MENVSSERTAARVILAFLQADCSIANVEYEDELLCLGGDIARDKNCNGPWINADDDGDLEHDGHLPSFSIGSEFDDIVPSVDLQRQHEEAALQQVAQGLREIAAQLEHNAVAQATQNLRRNLIGSPSNLWRYHLNYEVESVMRGAIGLEHLPQERVIMAVTLTLVKGVCKHTPRLLRSLFYTALQYITAASWAR